MTLTYWKCLHLEDHNCYSIRARTKREAAALREEYGPSLFSRPFKVQIEYRDAFDLIDRALCEGGVEPYPPEEARD